MSLLTEVDGLFIIVPKSLPSNYDSDCALRFVQVLHFRLYFCERPSFLQIVVASLRPCSLELAGRSHRGNDVDLIAHL